MEQPSNQFEDPKVNERDRKVREIVALTRELSARPEAFPFPGIKPESYARIKAEEEQYPGFATPIDNLLARFDSEGMKVVLSPQFPESGNIFILPKGSDDIGNDNLLPRHLQITETMDEKLKKLIELKGSL